MTAKPDRNKGGMRGQVPVWALVLTLMTGARGLAGERGGPAPPQLEYVLILADGPGPGGKREQPFLKRTHPVGGWHPDDGGLLHWWPRHCFPCVGGPDDYCRKPLPHVCWPPYPPYYTWGPPEICHPRGHGPRDGKKPH